MDPTPQPGRAIDDPLPPVTTVDAPPAPPAPRSSGVRSAVEWTVIVGGALVLAFLIKAFLLQAFYIPSESMVPTLVKGDRVLVNKVSYKFHEIHRGDIVVFKRPKNENDPNIKDLIKRIVGMPDETVEGRNGAVYINGRRLTEPYLNAPGDTADFPPTRIPKNHYFVMGDNRGNSKDSRYFGAIPRSLIVGRAFIRVWPLSSINLL